MKKKSQTHVVCGLLIFSFVGLLGRKTLIIIINFQNKEKVLVTKVVWNTFVLLWLSPQ